MKTGHCCVMAARWHQAPGIKCVYLMKQFKQKVRVKGSSRT